MFDPGTHTRTVLAMGFTADGEKLVSVGRDYTVQVWAAATGERLDVFRLPGYGHEKGFNRALERRRRVRRREPGRSAARRSAAGR